MSGNIFNGNGTDSGGGGGGSYDDTALKKRISSLEASQGQQDSLIAELEDSQGQQDSRIVSLETSQTQQDNRIAELETSQTQQDTLIAKNSGKIDRIADFVGIDLAFEYLPLAENQGVIIDDGIGIDTGLTLNGNANFTFKGCLKDNQHQVCLIGARTGTSTTERTCINALPKSGQIQSQWANNAYQVLKDEMNFLQPFDIISDKNQTLITQNGVHIATIANGGFVGINDETPICLFNQVLQNDTYYSPVLQRAEITIDGIKTVFEPKIKRNIETGAESVVLLKNGVEIEIDGLTLFEIQEI